MNNGKADTGHKRLLVVDDEANMRHMLSSLLGKSGYQVDAAADGYDALEKVQGTAYDFILCDIKMPRMDGMAFLAAAKDLKIEATIIMMSAYGSMDTAIEAMKNGAYDYISKPFKADEVDLVLRKAEERERLKQENVLLKARIRSIEENYRFGNMVANNKTMQGIFKLAEKVSHYHTTVLITGESGTGKELIARGIHFTGDRSERPWVPVNCGGIPENLIESELFGYRKGAFTGADRDKPGLFREADGGTLFLDEIGELPMPLQVKLLRVLQEGEIRPLGGARPVQVDVRIIAATAKDLEAGIQEGIFREDLFYRLNVVPIAIPPLRERREDIPLLVNLFIKRFNEVLGAGIESIAPEAMTLLIHHPWPGNVRELENVIQRAMVLSDGTTLTVDGFVDLADSTGAVHTGAGPCYEGDSLKQARQYLEKQMIEKVLRKTGGNRSQAARLLEISHPSLLSKIKQYRIDL